MLRTADLLASFRDFIAALRRSGFPWRRPLATEVAWPLLGRVILPLVDHSFDWTHSKLLSGRQNHASDGRATA